jgi:hypothetical protein
MTRTYTLAIEVEKVSGPDRDDDYVLDALAGSLGRENAARPPFRFKVGADFEAEGETTYEVKLVDSA